MNAVAQKPSGFEAEREFGFSIQARFPDLDVPESIAGEAVLVLDIAGARGLTMGRLARTLRRAIHGGIRSAVLTLDGREATLLEISTLLPLVEWEIAFKSDLGIERMLRACG